MKERLNAGIWRLGLRVRNLARRIGILGPFERFLRLDQVRYRRKRKARPGGDAGAEPTESPPAANNGIKLG
jgi:hypothetical protein